MATYLILAAVVLICAYAVYSYIRKLRVGGGCCGEREAAPKRMKVRDRDKRHYPYVLTVTVDGMVCANCTPPGAPRCAARCARRGTRCCPCAVRRERRKCEGRERRAPPPPFAHCTQAQTASRRKRAQPGTSRS